MGIKAVLFDLDGTLLPMDQELFTKAYFKELAAIVTPLGIGAEQVVKAVWAGTGEMIKNNGERPNCERFWECFFRLISVESDVCRPRFDRFYVEEFHRVRQAVGENPLAAEAVRLARGEGRRVILATNPIFPLDGQASRLGWIGLKVSDFDLVTSYESDRYCKPNPQYYLSICERMGLEPQDCLMVGNDEREDMYAANLAGMQCYLVTDCVIASETHPWQGDRGSFAEMLEMLRGLE